jgi:large subunit ribosomal protein L7/L12
MEKLMSLSEQLSALTILEAAELVKVLEEKWGVSAAAPVAVAAVAGGAAEAVEEKTEFDVVLSDAGANKMAVIKAIREVTTLGLKEAKDASEQAGFVLKTGVSKEEATSIQEKLKAAGATIQLK